MRPRGQQLLLRERHSPHARRNLTPSQTDGQAIAPPALRTAFIYDRAPDPFVQSAHIET